MNFRTIKIFSLSFILCSVLLSNCYGTAPVYGPTPMKTSSLTPVLTSAAVVQEENDADVIKIGNIDQLGIIDQWGLGYIHDVALSPDEETLAVATPSGVFLYDLNTMEEKQFIDFPVNFTFNQIFPPDRAVAFSPDSSLLAVAYDDIVIWDLKSNDDSQWILNTVADFIIDRVAFSPDGDAIVATSRGPYIPCDPLGGNYTLYDISSGAVLYSFYYCQHVLNSSYTFTDDDRVIFAGNPGDAYHASILERKTGMLVKEFGFEGHILSISPDGSKMAIQPFENRDISEIIDVDSEQVIDEVDGHVFFLQNGDQFIMDDISWKISTADHQKVCDFDIDTTSISGFDLHWSEAPLTENKLFFRNKEGNVEIWDASNCQLLKEFPIPYEIINSLKFNTGGNLMILGDYDHLYLKDVSSGENKFSISGDEAYSSDRYYDLSADGKTLVTFHQTASHTEKIFLWDTTSGKKVKTIPTSLNQLRYIKINSNGSVVAAMDYDAVYLWDTESGELLSTIPGRSDGLYFNPAGGNFALAGGGELVFRNDHSGEIEKSFPLSEKWFDIVFSSDWCYFVFIKYDQVELWGVDGNKIRDFKDYPPVVPNLERDLALTTNAKYDDAKFSPDNRLLVAIRSDYNGNLLRFWDVSNGKIIRDIEIPYVISELDFSPDGQLLFLQGDGLVYIMAVVEGE